HRPAAQHMQRVLIDGVLRVEETLQSKFVVHSIPPVGVAPSCPHARRAPAARAADDASFGAGRPLTRSGVRPVPGPGMTWIAAQGLKGLGAIGRKPGPIHSPAFAMTMEGRKCAAS